MLKKPNLGGYLSMIQHFNNAALVLLIFFCYLNAAHSTGLQQDSTREVLLTYLKTLPEELGVAETDDLASLETYIQKTEAEFDPEIVVEFADSLRSAVNDAANYQQGAEAIQKLYDSFVDELNSEQQHRFIIFAAELHGLDRKPDKVIGLLSDILPGIDPPDDLGKAYLALGSANQQLGKNDLAVEQFYSALDMFRKANNTKYLAETYNRIGSLFYFLEDFDVSIAYYQRHLEIAEKLDNTGMLENGYLNIGSAYRKSGDLKEALSYFTKGLEISEQSGKVRELARGKMNVANVYSEMKQFDDALRYYRESLALSEENDMEYGIMINQYNIGNLLFDQGRFDESEQAYLDAYNRMDRENNRYELRGVTMRLSTLYENTGKVELAFPFLKEFIEINSEIFDTEKLKITEDLRSAYEAERKEQDLILAETLLEKKRKQIWLTSLTALFLVSALFTGAIYYRRRNRYLQKVYGRKIKMLESLDIDHDTPKRSNKQDAAVNDISDLYSELFAQIKPLFKEKKVFKDSNLNLSKVSKMAGSNRKYVSEAINKKTGMNYNSYVNFYRVNEAKKFILEGNESMGEVQEQCGFNSRTTFYSSFKKFTGMSPTEFKKMSRKRVNGEE